MRRFFTSFLGALAAFWITIVLVMFALFLGLGLFVAAKAGGGKSTAKIEKGSVLLLNLDMTIGEKADLPDLRSQLMRGNVTLPVRLADVVKAIEAAASDDHIEGIFIDCEGLDAGAAQVEAICEALNKFSEKAPSKWIWAYGDMIGQSDYVVASTADSVFVNPCGTIDLHGLTVFNQNFKRLLDKVGVKMQVVKVGTYKSAVEPYILDAPSPANIEQEKLFLNNVWGSLAGRIARGRSTDVAAVNSWVDSLSVTRSAQWYVSSHMADALCYRHEMDSKLRAATGRDKDDELSLVALSDYLNTAAVAEIGSKGKVKIGVYYAEGEITDSGREGISGRDMVADLLDLADEDELDGLVIRVNSPGGSAFASEQIWEAVENYKSVTGNPVYVSMGDYAASGGYYISCGADRIWAQPTTLTGSIGIFGLIPDASGLVDGKLGMTTTPVSTNPGAEPINIFTPLSPRQTAAMQAYVNRGYELFVSRVAKGRGLTVDQVKAIAEGRVWDGREAKARKLVDELGGLTDAVAAMGAHLKAEKWTIEEYPAGESGFLQQLLAGLGGIGAEASPLADAIPAEAAPLLQALRYLSGASGVQAYQTPFIMR